MRALALLLVLTLLLAGCTAPPAASPASVGEQSTQTSEGADARPAPRGTPEPKDPEDPEPSDPEPKDPEPSDPEPKDPEPSDPEPKDPGPSDAAPGRQEPDWGAPSSKGLRPGINMAHDGSGCTTSFLFHVDWKEYYMATAAHCVNRNSPCEPGTTKSSTPAELRLTDGSRVNAPVAYDAWATMTRVGESHGHTCSGNDFALLRIPDEAVGRIHPASLHFQAPTGLATSPTGDIWGYGASSLKLGLGPTHPKQGIHLGMAESGWSHHVYLATPGIPGDSGGHILTEDGQALGIASRVAVTPLTGSNYYTDVAKSLEYMLQHEGWAPELITLDDFNPGLV